MLVEKEIKHAIDLAARFGSSIGTSDYTRHPLGFLYTDGIEELCSKLKCWWVLDVIGSYLPRMRKMQEESFIWRLSVLNNRATIYCLGYSGEVLLWQDIEYTDQNDGYMDIKIADNGDFWIACLPIED